MQPRLSRDFESSNIDLLFTQQTLFAQSMKHLEGEKMKPIILAAVVIVALTGVTLGQSTKQNAALDQETRKIDMAEANGPLKKDVAALEKLWADDFTVNNPRNGITHGRKGVLALIENGTIDYASFVLEIETMSFHGDVVIVMGQETIKPVSKAPFAGQTVRRRYTHFWMKRKGTWLLTACHANVICQN